MEHPTFEALCALEPRLAELLTAARAVRDNKRTRAFCANAVWYGYGKWPGIKPRLLPLIGWEREGSGPPLLRSREAYDVAYHTLYEQLPNCRNCICL